MFTAIIFAVGVGLPGYSIQSAGLRTLFSLIGMLWALLGIEIQRFAISHRITTVGVRKCEQVNNNNVDTTISGAKEALL